MLETTLFIYGTLMRGQANHRFCKRAKNIEEAVACGKLYQLPPGYPALQVPDESVLMIGTKDVFANAQDQYRENNDMDFEFKIYNGWGTVHGELVTFSDPERDIPPIDKLEGTPFYYERVLVPVQKPDGSTIAAFAYTMDEIHFTARYLPNGVWPETRRVQALCK